MDIISPNVSGRFLKILRYLAPGHHHMIVTHKDTDLDQLALFMTALFSVNDLRAFTRLHLVLPDEDRVNIRDDITTHRLRVKGNLAQDEERVIKDPDVELREITNKIKFSGQSYAPGMSIEKILTQQTHLSHAPFDEPTIVVSAGTGLVDGMYLNINYYLTLHTTETLGYSGEGCYLSSEIIHYLQDTIEPGEMTILDLSVAHRGSLKGLV